MQSEKWLRSRGATAARKVRVLFSISENNAVTFLRKIVSYGAMIAAKMGQPRGRAKFMAPVMAAKAGSRVRATAQFPEDGPL